MPLPTRPRGQLKQKAFLVSCVHQSFSLSRESDLAPRLPAQTQPALSTPHSPAAYSWSLRRPSDSENHPPPTHRRIPTNHNARINRGPNPSKRSDLGEEDGEIGLRAILRSLPLPGGGGDLRSRAPGGAGTGAGDPQPYGYPRKRKPIHDATSSPQGNPDRHSAREPIEKLLRRFHAICSHG